MINPMMFPQFMQQMRGQNPRTLIETAVRSGRLNQQQLDQVQAMARQMQGSFEQFRNMFGFGGNR